MTLILHNLLFINQFLIPHARKLLFYWNIKFYSYRCVDQTTYFSVADQVCKTLIQIYPSGGCLRGDWGKSMAIWGPKITLNIAAKTLIYDFGLSPKEQFIIYNNTNNTDQLWRIT